MTLRSIVLAACMIALAIAPAAAEPSDANKQLAAAHYKLGSTLYDQGRFDEAFDEFEQAYQLAPKPLVIFHMARARQHAGKLDEALGLYKRYLQQEPNGKGAAEATAQVAAIQKQLDDAKAAAAAKATPPPPPPPPDTHVATTPTPTPTPEPDTATRPDLRPDHVAATVAPDHDDAGTAAITTTPPPEGAHHQVRWPWIGAAVAAVALGVVLDTAPSSAGNHKLDALDFAPIGCYGAGAVAAAFGVGWF